MILSISDIEGPAAVPAIERILPGPCIGNSNAILPLITVAGVPPFHSDEIAAELLIRLLLGFLLIETYFYR